MPNATLQTTTTTTTTSSTDFFQGASAGLGQGDANFEEYTTTSGPTPTIAQAFTSGSFDTLENNDSSSLATVTPLKGSFAVSRKNKILNEGMGSYAQVTPMEYENSYSAFTYKPSVKTNYVTKHFKTTTYNVKTHY